MGGFLLQGPNYRIVNVPNATTCRCSGYKGDIDEKLESILVNKKDKTLNLADLPEDMQKEIIKYHLGTSLKYKILHKSTYTHDTLDITAERAEMLKNIKYSTITESPLLATNRATYESMFAPLI